MSKGILEGYAWRLGRDFSVKKFDQLIDEVLSPNFNDAAADVVELASQLTAEFQTDPQVYMHISRGVSKLAVSGIGHAFEVSEQILDSLKMPGHDYCEPAFVYS